MAETLKELIAKRGLAKGSISRMVTYADTVTERSPVSEITTRLDLLERAFNEFTKCETKLAVHEVQSEMPEYESKYLNVKTKLAQFITKPKIAEEASHIEKMMTRILQEQNEFMTTLSSSFTTSLNQTVSQSLDEPHCSVRLPRLNVPTFSGEYKEFPSFKDLYTAAVHSKLALNDVEKFQYLRGYLQGEAADLIKHITISEANYTQAWKKLCERYDKRKYVLNSMIKCFIDQPLIQEGSSKRLRQLFNNADEVNRGIEALGGEARNRDPWLIYLLLHKTDLQTQQAWAQRTVNQDFPSFEEFLKFISERCDAFESCEPTRHSTNKAYTTKSHHMKPISENNEVCLFCNDTHKLHQCESFKNLKVDERREQVAKLHVCFNCLASNHLAKRCLSQRGCAKCGRRHHTLLHTEIASTVNQCTMSPDLNDSTGPNGSRSTIEDEEPALTRAVSNTSKCGFTLLPTAIVNVRNQFGRFRRYNLLLDSGSQVSFVSQKCMNQLGIRSRPGKLRIEGLATSNVSTMGSATLEISSQFDVTNWLKINVLVLPKITTLSACIESCNNLVTQFPQLQFADQTFYKHKEIDILLGADYFFHVLRDNQVQLTNNMIARETVFGYVIAGTAHPDDEREKFPIHKTCHINIMDDQPLEEILRRFWEQEEVVEHHLWTAEEEACETHFKATYARNAEGRYIVQLPLREGNPPLGRSHNVAWRRLLAEEQKFNRNPDLKEMYHKFMDEYLSLEHMRLVSEDQLNQGNHSVYFLPHHGILKETSITTKLRVVFDGSALTSTGVSLNDKLMVGPTLQDTLWTILIRFRGFKVAISEDIEKMYRQVLVDQSQTSLQRVLWRKSQTDPIKQYELMTVTYGTSSAPFLAIRVLHQIAEDCKVTYPVTSNIIKKNFYVDDLLTGADNETQADIIKTEISTILGQAGMTLRKWRSNVDKFNDTSELIHITEEGRTAPMLGIYWDSTRDKFGFKIIEVPNISFTKRSMLSISAKIFDPLGWLAPFTINVKLSMQQLWLRKVSWDEPLPLDVQKTWVTLHGQFQSLNAVTIDRYVGLQSGDIQLHGFSDSSETAYAATIYVRRKTGNQHVVRLLTAKSKVAPIKQVSLPRLELCGAHLLTKLMNKVVTAYELEGASIWLWTDSTIVLAWLATHPRRWKTFVANRVSAIHTLLPQATWRHVNSKDNPADFATRGIPANQLVNNELWFSGPRWLSSDEKIWPAKPIRITTLQETRSKESAQCHASFQDNTMHTVQRLLERFSKWSQLIRSMAYILRFINNTKNKMKISGNISVTELDNAEKTIIRYVQQREFIEDIKSLNKTKRVLSSSKLISLAPFLDSQNVLRVGGWLENSNCTYDMKHPIIIPRNHQIANLILQYLHKLYLHPGPTLLTALSRHKYWILGIREKCRKLCHDCTTCFRYSTLRSAQQMGNLPQPRITPSRPFSIVGLDYAGPVMLATKKGRGARLIKGFIVIFVCFATKALHIEMASDLTTEAFLAALDRFVGRRGAPTEIYSDNGSNFVGAKRALLEHCRLLQTTECKDKVINYTTTKRIHWHLIPPISPHFGGIWERSVRSVKTHLVKVIGNTHLTYEEMETVLIQIEGILNSRPLCAIRNEDTCNIDTLTPAHFLTLGPMTSLPHAEYEEINMSRLTRWEQVQKLVQSFWRRYTVTNLNTLQQRTKWQQKNRNLKVDDIVLVHDNKSPPCSWQLGRISQLHPGNDGLVRVATVQTKGTTYKRPISKLFRLPIDEA